MASLSMPGFAEGSPALRQYLVADRPPSGMSLSRRCSFEKVEVQFV